ncbi:MAG TPA: phosphate ABC transporter permease PstA [Bryobacteraceae bacterium]|jgi:phosphate transport system permease protein|nr:phosphate ABC transporter permease PstA [Bryobacteraceae bacterium]
MGRTKRRNLLNNVMLALTGVCTFVTVSVLFVILGFLVWNGFRSLDWNFFTKLPLSAGETGGGLANAIVGSGITILISIVIGVPVGFLGGIYLAEFGGKTFPMFVRYTADLLNGVPSIVIGIFAWTVVVKPMHSFSAWAGGFALSLMMIPIGLRSTEHFLRSVPNSMREGALALGATKTRTILTVIVPAARQGILTGLILGVARVAGETAPLLFTSLNNQFWSEKLTEPTATLPVMIYKLAISAYDDWHRQAWAAGLVLLGLVLLANIAARWVLSRGASVQRG